MQAIIKLDPSYAPNIQFLCEVLKRKIQQIQHEEHRSSRKEQVDTETLSAMLSGVSE
jgi:hypothetical protein